ncbi:alternate signal-mediated exported protein [Glaciihabitans tibetensis]|uniref:Alternate signal-mediated exported protein n=1 Tax=Glaciihabitans tibetensis TaxID=1266600 RepID=A0A2T0V3C4_9MICO|nr:alternate-type signal peptide domain-containing protein [Glaciihabitans tibetensis]PRY64673.1 alternate signal-mediated exported protein [Glaciihabitans tibetensis]
MNKLTSGAIVGTLGIALLLGGAGTFAMWNSTTTADAGTVASGTLTIAKSSTASWKNVSTDAPAGGVAIPSISAYKIVPGDTVQMTQVFTVAATGNNLVATLSYDDLTIGTTGTDAAATAANVALKSASTISMVASGTGVTAGAAANTFTVAPNASGVSTVTVTLTVALPTTVSGLTAQNGTLNLSAVSFNLVQNTRP